jgi:hypothetical protein
MNAALDLEDIHTTRLLMLADALDVWPPERFNLRDFVSQDGERVCALGLAVRMFGLELGMTWYDQHPWTANGGDWFAVTRELFGFDVGESHALFHLGYGLRGDESPKEMATVIRAFVRNGDGQ